MERREERGSRAQDKIMSVGRNSRRIWARAGGWVQGAGDKGAGEKEGGVNDGNGIQGQETRRKGVVKC